MKKHRQNKPNTKSSSSVECEQTTEMKEVTASVSGTEPQPVPQTINISELQSSDPCAAVGKSEQSSDTKHSEQEATKSFENEINEMKQKLQELLSERDDWKNQYIRIKADFENYRKREEERFSRAVASSRELLVEALLPVYESFNRALDLCKPETSIDGLKAGLDLAHKLFIQVLLNNGVKIFGAVNEAFDPALHNAISKDDNVPDGEYTEIISQVYQSGIMVNGRVFKPAMVKVGYQLKPKAENVDNVDNKLENNNVETKSDNNSINDTE